MSVALVGLLLLQIFWIDNVHFITNERFKDNIQSCLERTISKLEAIEAKELMNPIAFEKGLQGSYADFVKSEYGQVIQYEDATEVRDTTLIVKGEPQKYLVVNGIVTDSATGLVSETRVLTKDLGEIVPVELEDPVSIDSNSLWIQLDKSFERQIMIKARRLNELVVNMFADNLFDEIAFRLDLAVLDSVIVENLNSLDMDTNFTYNIVDLQGRSINFTKSTRNRDSTLSESDYQTLLFQASIAY
jgi:two-component system, OmpR family, phosphate regulon sensor histidine kinase PhoR